MSCSRTQCVSSRTSQCRVRSTTRPCLTFKKWRLGTQVVLFQKHHMSQVMRKPDFAYTKTKPQISCSHCTADQCICICYMDSTLPLLLKSEISSLWLFSLTLQASLCLAWFEIPKPCFLMLWLISGTSF